jgi:ABC-2 type transport system ATP-binding protein
LEGEIRTLARRLDLNITERIQDLSKGNRQKVSVIQAFMHSPDVLFLDEPTSGLDPLVQREFEKILDEARDRGAAVILSSHVLSEVEHLADRIAIIDQGSIVVVDEISTLKAKARRRIDLFFEKQIAEGDFAKVPNIKEIEVVDGSLRCVVTGSEFELLKRAVDLGVTEVRTHESSLEEIFLGLVGAK